MTRLCWKALYSRLLFTASVDSNPNSVKLESFWILGDVFGTKRASLFLAGMDSDELMVVHLRPSEMHANHDVELRPNRTQTY
ncbi:hypothetical protein SCHPADRAFT_94115 [Schizopora paradoxa]|uniref:Uncharacterized protein n=1 Tax=Schizopora paradoxa TaxID=27342 RepID=A0A0H2S4U0_9AGAM|nr:hypothetical protein SCHPADRAFT_94115 [Schizopora paradoxa]